MENRGRIGPEVTVLPVHFEGWSAGVAVSATNGASDRTPSAGSRVPTPLVTTAVYYADGALWKLTYPSGLQLELVRDAATREVVEIRNMSAGTSFASQIVHFPGGLSGSTGPLQEKRRKSGPSFFARSATNPHLTAP